MKSATEISVLTRTWEPPDRLSGHVVLKHLGSPSSPVSTQLHSLGEPLRLAGSHFPHRSKERKGCLMGMPRSSPALTSMIPRLRKYIQASKIKCNKAAKHTFEQKAYYYLFFHIISW